jgi:hypothetical protein
MMTTAFASQPRARSTGNGKRQAQCPAHFDRPASLSIREDDLGKVLVHGFADCTLENPLQALGRAHKDLYNLPQPSAEQVRKMAVEGANRDQEVAAGDRRARLPDDWLDGEAITSLFHILEIRQAIAVETQSRREGKQ